MIKTFTFTLMAFFAIASVSCKKIAANEGASPVPTVLFRQNY